MGEQLLGMTFFDYSPVGRQKLPELEDPTTDATWKGPPQVSSSPLNVVSQRLPFKGNENANITSYHSKPGQDPEYRTFVS